MPNTPPPDTPAHHIRMARIYLQQARETVHRDWFFTLLTWAGERRRRAAELMRAGPQQKELFAAEALLASIKDKT